MPTDSAFNPLEQVVLDIICQGRSRCGIGFGKYPLGIRDAVERLLPIIDTEKIRERLADFDARLAKP